MRATRSLWSLSLMLFLVWGCGGDAVTNPESPIADTAAIGHDLGFGPADEGSPPPIGRVPRGDVGSDRGTIIDELENAVIQNCLLVQAAVNQFAWRNAGVYPNDLSDVTVGGQTVVDFLPGGTLLTNPFDRVATQPINGSAALCGETGYQALVQSGIPTGYIITGFGHEAEILLLSNVAE